MFLLCTSYLPSFNSFLSCSPSPSHICPTVRPPLFQRLSTADGLHPPPVTNKPPNDLLDVPFSSHPFTSISFVVRFSACILRRLAIWYCAAATALLPGHCSFIYSILCRCLTDHPRRRDPGPSTPRDPQLSNELGAAFCILCPALSKELFEQLLFESFSSSNSLYLTNPP